MKVRIEGMSCGHCSARVEKALRSLEGVEDVKVSLDEKMAEIKGDVSLEDVKNVIEETGYDFKGEVK